MKKKNVPQQGQGISESGSAANQTDDKSSSNSPDVPATKSIPIGIPVSPDEFKRLKKKAEEKKESSDNNNSNNNT